ncbi:hypothetical protein ES705_26774 [subsurface metagenome]
MYKDKGKHLPVDWEIFSTVEPALEWTQQFQLTIEDYEKIIKNLDKIIS